MTLTTILKPAELEIRTQYHINTYPCRDETASLRVPPVGMTRETAFCTVCPFYRDGVRRKGCLFVPSRREEDYLLRRNPSERQATLRKEGLNSVGQPLKRVCWNCDSIRFNPPKYCCNLRIIGSRTAASMQQTRPCELFNWRKEIEILLFED